MSQLKYVKRIKLLKANNNSITFLEKKRFFKDFKRFFIIDQKNEILRGNHAHKRAFQVIICLDEFCEFDLFDGKNNKKIILKKLDEAIYIPPMIWLAKLKLKKIIVFTNQFYSEKEYIRSLPEYFRLKKIKSNH